MFDVTLHEARALIAPVLAEPLPFNARILANYLLGRDVYHWPIIRDDLAEVHDLLIHDPYKPKGTYRLTLVGAALDLARQDRWIRSFCS